jgi:hypothetical protein
MSEMNFAQASRDLRRIEDPFERYREWKIQRIQATCNMDRENAAHTLEWLEIKMANVSLALACGAFACVFLPIEDLVHCLETTVEFSKSHG